MSLKSEIGDLLQAAETKLRNESAHIAVSERNRMLDHLLAAIGAVRSADEPEQHEAEPAAAEVAAEPVAEAAPAVDASSAE